MNRTAILAVVGLILAGVRLGRAQVIVEFCDLADESCVEDNLKVLFDDGTSRLEAPPLGTEIRVRIATDTTSSVVQGWSYAVKHDPSVLTILEATTAGTIVHLGGLDGNGLDSIACAPNFDVTSTVPGAGRRWRPARAICPGCLTISSVGEWGW